MFKRLFAALMLVVATVADGATLYTDNTYSKLLSSEAVMVGSDWLGSDMTYPVTDNMALVSVLAGGRQSITYTGNNHAMLVFKIDVGVNFTADRSITAANLVLHEQGDTFQAADIVEVFRLSSTPDTVPAIGSTTTYKRVKSPPTVSADFWATPAATGMYAAGAFGVTLSGSHPIRQGHDDRQTEAANLYIEDPATVVGTAGDQETVQVDVTALFDGDCINADTYVVFIVKMRGENAGTNSWAETASFWNSIRSGVDKRCYLDITESGGSCATPVPTATHTTAPTLSPTPVPTVQPTVGPGTPTWTPAATATATPAGTYSTPIPTDTPFVGPTATNTPTPRYTLSRTHMPALGMKEVAPGKWQNVAGSLHTLGNHIVDGTVTASLIHSITGSFDVLDIPDSGWPDSLQLDVLRVGPRIIMNNDTAVFGDGAIDTYGNWFFGDGFNGANPAFLSTDGTRNYFQLDNYNYWDKDGLYIGDIHGDAVLGLGSLVVIDIDDGDDTLVLTHNSDGAVLGLDFGNDRVDLAYNTFIDGTLDLDTELTLDAGALLGVDSNGITLGNIATPHAFGMTVYNTNDAITGLYLQHVGTGNTSSDGGFMVVDSSERMSLGTIESTDFRLFSANTIRAVVEGSSGNFNLQYDMEISEGNTIEWEQSGTDEGTMTFGNTDDMFILDENDTSTGLNQLLLGPDTTNGGYVYADEDASAAGGIFHKTAEIFRWFTTAIYAAKPLLLLTATDYFGFQGEGRLYCDGTNNQLYFSDATPTRRWHVDYDDGRMVMTGPVNLGAVGTSLTVLSNAITVTKSYHKITNAGSTELHTINGGSDGDELTLVGATAITTVIKDGSGNIQCQADITFDSANDVACFIFNGTNWLLKAPAQVAN